MARSQEISVICRKYPDGHNREALQDVNLTAINVGNTPIVSGVLFILISSILSTIISLKGDYDCVYCFQSSLIQGWVASKFSTGRLVAGLQSVPVRQSQDFLSGRDREGSISSYVYKYGYQLYSKIIGHILKSSDRIICLTDGIRCLTEEMYEVDMSDATIIGMGVDLDLFSRENPTTTQNKTGWEIVYVGSITENRGIEHVIETVSNSNHDLQFKVVGDGPEAYVSSLKQLTVDRDVTDSIEWVGRVPHETVPELLSAADFAISPLQDIESYQVSFPAKILEYMAAECLVIATEIPAHESLIEHGVSGYLYDGTQPGLLNTLEQAIESNEKNRDIRKRGLKIAENYDWEIIVDKHERTVLNE